jgi:hypothetical protein
MAHCGRAAPSFNSSLYLPCHKCCHILKRDMPSNVQISDMHSNVAEQFCIVNMLQAFNASNNINSQLACCRTDRSAEPSQVQ